MPCLTQTEKSKATTKLWFSRILRHPARNGVGLFWDTYIHTYYLLTFPGATQGWW